MCREQQKLMKSIKSESMTKIRDEEEKRKETQAHFQKSINEIFQTLGKNNDENLKIKEANTEMTKKFKFLAEQYELREKQLEKLNEQIKLETQLNEAKLAKVHMESTIEKEILLKEKQAALEEILSTKKAIAEMENRERALKDQLSIYTEKYDQFQTTLQKSNDIFGTYKTELEKMAKKIKMLEKEAYDWRIKYEKSNRALLNTTSDKLVQDEYTKKLGRQLAQLQKLCRTLQAERTALLDVLKANNIERPPMPELPPEPVEIEPAPKQTDRLDVMSQNCKELKETLAQLQGQLNAIEKDDKQKGKNPAPENKKNKSKKNKAKNGKVAAEESQPSAVATDVASNGENTPSTTSNEDKTVDDSAQVPVESNSESAASQNEDESPNPTDVTPEIAPEKTPEETPEETPEKDIEVSNETA